MPCSKVIGGVVAVVLVAAIAVPAAALAGPGVSLTGLRDASSSRDTTRSASGGADRVAILKARITRALKRRAAVFGAAKTRILDRANAVDGVAEQVSEAGADVSGVRAKLDLARTSVAQADRAEAVAVALFKKVPDALDRRAAFRAARKQAKVAAGTLDKARVSGRNAVLDLRAIVNGLRGAAQ